MRSDAAALLLLIGWGIVGSLYAFARRLTQSEEAFRQSRLEQLSDHLVSRLDAVVEDIHAVERCLDLFDMDSARLAVDGSLARMYPAKETNSEW